MRIGFALGLLVFVSSCATLSAGGNFEKALEALRDGPPDATTTDKFKELCESGHELSCAWTGQNLAGKTEPSGQLAIMQGMSADSYAQFAVLVPKAEKYNYAIYPRHLLDSGNPLAQMRLLRVKREETPGSEWALEYIEVGGLESALGYNLDVVDSRGNLLDRRRFHSLDLSQIVLKFAVASAPESQSANSNIWSHLLEQNPDLILLFNPSSSSSSFSVQNVELRRKLPLFRQVRLTPILFFNGAGDPDSLAASFFAQNKISGLFEKGPQAESFFQAGGQNFLLTHSGADENWLKERLLQTKVPSWVISLSPLKNDWMPWKEVKSPPLVFLVGEGASTGVQKISREQLGYESYQFISGGNFLIFETKLARQRWFIKAKGFDVANQVLFEQQVQLR